MSSPHRVIPQPARRKFYEATANCDGIAPVDWHAGHPDMKLSRAYSVLDEAAYLFHIPDGLLDRMPNHSLTVSGSLSLTGPGSAQSVFTFPCCGYLLHGEGLTDFRKGVSLTYAGKPAEPGTFIREDPEAFPNLAALTGALGLDGDNDRLRALVWEHVIARFERSACDWYAARKLHEIRQCLGLRPGRVGP